MRLPYPGTDQLLSYALSQTYLGSWKFLSQENDFFVDPALLKSFGYEGSNVLTLENFKDCIAEDYQQSFNEQIASICSSHSIQTTSIILCLSAAPEEPVLMSATSFFNGQGELEGVAGSFIKLPQTSIPEMEAHQTQVLTENIPDVITRWDNQLRLLFANTAFVEKAGLVVSELLGKTNLEMGQPGHIARPYMESLQRVLDRGLPTEHFNPFPTPDGNVFYHSRMTPEFGPDGRVISVLAVARDISALKEKEMQLVLSEQRFSNLIDQAPVATCLFTGPEMIVEIANDLMIGFWGKDRSVIGMPLVQAVPELVGQPYLQILQDVFLTGQAYEQKSAPAVLHVNGQLSTFYFDFTYKPLRDADGNIYGIVDMAVDVTQQTLQQQELLASEQRFRNMIASAPAAVGLFIGPELIVESPNQGFTDIIGKGPDIAGQKLADLMPELENQDFLRLLEEVYRSGQPFQTSQAPLDLMKANRTERRYYNISFTPLRDGQGAIYGILDISVDVTQAVMANEKIRLAEASLRNVVEMAELGTWTADVKNRTIECSPRLRQWYGLESEGPVSIASIAALIDPQDFTAFSHLLKGLPPVASSYASYDTSYRISALDGVKRFFRDQGQVWFDQNGIAATVTGSVQDISDQVRESERLKEQVASAAGQLDDSHRDLQRSDANLLQFAYVASHDLQEPLRKIQTFANLLSNQYSDTLGSGIAHLERIEHAAQRMSVLVQDLLEYSQISTNQQKDAVVDLNLLIGDVLEDLDLKISESQAQLSIQQLPSVKGERSQLGQLFNNLISNALKFHKPGQAPVIDISCKKITRRELPDGVLPSRNLPHYYHIKIKDEGVGFDQGYAQRIFQVFQRLHSKSEFEGTGIGLAICEKVASNHGGAIQAESAPGQGATFSVYLPA